MLIKTLKVGVVSNVCGFAPRYSVLLATAIVLSIAGTFFFALYMNQNNKLRMIAAVDEDARVLRFGPSKQMAVDGALRDARTISCTRRSAMAFACKDDAGRVYNEVPLHDIHDVGNWPVSISCPILQGSDYLLVGWDHCYFMHMSDDAVFTTLRYPLFINTVVCAFLVAGLVVFMLVSAAVGLTFSMCLIWVDQFDKELNMYV